MGRAGSRALDDRRVRAVLAAALTLGLVAGGLVLRPARARADEITVSDDLFRTGWDPNEPKLSPANVEASDFGELFSTTVDGQVYAQPLVVGNLLVAVTENNQAYGIDKVSGAVRWSHDFGTPFSSASIGCGDLTPNVGSTATPVYDPSTQTVYLTTKNADGTDSQHPHWYLQAISVSDGTERPRFPVTIQGTPENTPGIAFNPFTAMQRPGLLLMNGVVYMGFGAHCDIKPYRGYVVGVSTTTHAITTMWSDEAGSGADQNSEAGIWQSGGGLVSDGPNQILLATGNGISPPQAPGSPTPPTLAESVVRVVVGSDGKLSATDFFSPHDAPTLDQNDTDLGSGGPVALPSPTFGTADHPHLLVQVGKDGRVFLLDRDDLGGRKQGPGGSDDVLQTGGPFNGVWGHPAAYGGEGGWVYTVENSGFLRAFSYGLNGSGVPQLTPAGTSQGTFGYTSGSPAVSSTGTTPGSAVVWVVYSTGSSGTNAQLRAYQAVPSAGVLPLLWSAPIGTASKFVVPATDDGRVYVGTRDGHVIGFGRPAAAALQTTPTDVGRVVVGGSRNVTVTATATRDVQVNDVSVTGPFTATPPSLPVLLHAGDSIAVGVRFSPTDPGDAMGQLSFDTDAGPYAADLHGYGLAPGLIATPPAVDFGELAVGAGGKTLAVSVSNSWLTNETITSITAPASPFTISGAPPPGTVLAPQASVGISVNYDPTEAGTNDDQLVVRTNKGSVTIPLSGSAVAGEAHLTLTPTATNFGSVAVGSARTLSFDVSNTGNIPLTITKAKAPAGVFSTSTPLSEGLTLGPDQVVHQSVTFAPTALGQASAHYLITADDGQGQQTEMLVGRGVTGLPDPTHGWQLNGSAAVRGPSVVLTTAQSNLDGSDVFPTAVSTNGLDASFVATIGGGTGADGMTFSLLNASDSGPTSLGAGGGGLGYGGLDGIAVALDTFKNQHDPSSNFVGVSTGTVSGTDDNLVWAQTNTGIAPLRTGAHQVRVTVRGQVVKVWLDGAQVLDVTVPVPPTAYVAFTGATGGSTDRHSVTDAVITIPGPLP